MANEGPESREASKNVPGADVGPPAGRRLGGARADFVAGLGRKIGEMRAVFTAYEADPRASGPRDELRRKLHALGAAARLLHFDAMATCIVDAEGVLERVAKSGPASGSELGRIAQALDDLPALAWGEGPPDGVRPEASAASLPAAGISALVIGGAPLADALTEGSDSPESIFDCERVDQPSGALNVARALAPDVIVVDGELPGALDLVEALLDDPLTEPVPIIVLGAFTGPEQAARYIALGVAKALVKPVSPGALRRACQEVIDQREGRTMPMTLGEPTLEQLGQRLSDEMKRALVDCVDSTARSCRVPLGEGAEVVGALWGAIARVREVVTMRTNGAVRYSGGGPEGAVAMAPWLHPDSLGSDRLASIERGRGAAVEVDLHRRIVVVADDDPGVTWFISDLLRTVGCVVHEALDGAQALKLAWELSPELVVSDILMPGLDGFALSRALRRDVALRDTPVILLSWKEDLLQRVRELGASAAAYLRKESDARSIVARVREVLRPRARVEARLRGEGEVRGRLDGLTVHSLLRLVSASRPSSRVLVRDASFLYEIDLFAGAPRRATRTATDGSFQQGERVLAALLGVGAGRFVVTPLPGDMRSRDEGDLEGPLHAQIAKPVAHARAALAAATGANTMNVVRLQIDQEMVQGYLLATPEPARSIVQRIAQGESPRDMILRGEVAPSILEDVVADLAARGAILAVEGAGGEDLLRAVVTDRARAKGREREGRVSVRPEPSPLPASELVARELPVVKDAGARRSRPSMGSWNDGPPPSSRRDPMSEPPSSLEDAVIRAMSDGSRSKPPPSSEQPPIVEPSDLRPRSSNPPAEAPERALPSLPPDAIVPASPIGDGPMDTGKTEPMQMGADVDPDPLLKDVSVPIPIEVEPTKPTKPTKPPPVPSRVRSTASSAPPPAAPVAAEPPAPELTSPAPAAATKPPNWRARGLLIGALAVVALGGLRWFGADDMSSDGAGEEFAGGGVTYAELPPQVSVPEGQGLLEVAVRPGESLRIDGAEAPAPSEGRVRLPVAAGTHVVQGGARGAERSRSVQVRVGRLARVALDGP